jgi:cell division septal protein FtsQ
MRATKSQKIRSRLFWLSSILIVSLLAYILGWSQFFRVTGISIDGLQPQAKELISSQIKRESLIQIGEPLARVDARVVERSLLKNQWVGNVQVSRHWFSGEVNLFVVERSAIARIIGDTQFKYLTDQGQIAIFPEVLSETVPELSGAYQDKESVLRAKELLGELSGALDSQLTIKSLSIGSPTSFSTVAKIGEQELTIRWGSVNEIPLKIKVLQGLLALPENSQLKLVDLSAPLSPIVK